MRNIFARFSVLLFALAAALSATRAHALPLAYTEPTPTGVSDLEPDAFGESGHTWRKFHAATLDSPNLKQLQVTQTKTLPTEAASADPSPDWSEPELDTSLLGGLAAMLFMARRRRPVY